MAGQERSLRRRKSPVWSGQKFAILEEPRDCSDPSEDARAMLESFSWKPQCFEAVCRPRVNKGDAIVEFPSPSGASDVRGGPVKMTWYAARNRRGDFINGPAVIVLDVLQARNFVSGFVARSFSRNGIHGFVLDLPHPPVHGQNVPDFLTMFRGTRQAVIDARRARDVVAALPNVDGRVGIQGTSFGGFVATMAASLDRAFDLACLAICGGNFSRVLREGRLDAARMRRRFADAGIDGPEAIDEFLRQVEPLRIAHRLNPETTWLWSARRDQVVPPACSRELAHAARLPANHFRRLGGCHYTCALAAPWWMGQIINTAREVWSNRAASRRIIMRSLIGA